jgi:hypothetical protein
VIVAKAGRVSSGFFVDVVKTAAGSPAIARDSGQQTTNLFHGCK